MSEKYLRLNDDEYKWDGRYLRLAREVSTWSKDPSRKVGSVIVDNKKRVLSLGYNGFPRGVEDKPEMYEDRETKLLFVCHAERNALDNAPNSVEGATLYSTLFPCNECAKSIVQRGIKNVITVQSGQETDRFNSGVTVRMFKEAGISLRVYNSLDLFDEFEYNESSDGDTNANNDNNSSTKG